MNGHQDDQDFTLFLRFCLYRVVGLWPVADLVSYECPEGSFEIQLHFKIQNTPLRNSKLDFEVEFTSKFKTPLRISKIRTHDHALHHH
jgi:hypothetical protein